MTKTSFIDNYAISQIPFKTKKSYGVCIQNFDNDDLKHTIHYEIEVICIVNNVDHSFVFELDRKQVYINNIEPDLKIEKIATKAGSALFPIQIKTNLHGQIAAIVNYKAIKKRWLLVKQDIEDYFKGGMAQKIVDNIETILFNEEDFKQSLYKNWFFTLYFSPLYMIYNATLKRQVKRDYPIFGDKTAQYEAIHRLNNKYTSSSKIAITIEGKATDVRTIEEVISGESDLKSQFNPEVVSIASEFELQYFLNINDNSINSINGSFKTKINNANNKITAIEIIEL
jgi:hypothetical protein